MFEDGRTLALAARSFFCCLSLLCSSFFDWATVGIYALCILLVLEKKEAPQIGVCNHKVRYTLLRALKRVGPLSEYVYV